MIKTSTTKLYSGIYINKNTNTVAESMVIAGFLHRGERGIEIKFCHRSSRQIYLKKTNNMTKSYCETHDFRFKYDPTKCIPIVINLIKEINTRRPVYMIVQGIDGSIIDRIDGAGFEVIYERDPKKVEIVNAFYGYPALRVLSKAPDLEQNDISNYF